MRQMAGASRRRTGSDGETDSGSANVGTRTHVIVRALSLMCCNFVVAANGVKAHRSSVRRSLRHRYRGVPTVRRCRL